MSEQSFNDEVHHTVAIITGMVFLVLGLDWLLIVIGFTFSIEKVNLVLHDFVISTHPYLYLFRVGYIAGLCGFFYLKKPKYVFSGKGVFLRRIIHFLLILIFILGYSNTDFYNRYIYPVFFFISIYSVYAIYTTFIKRLLSEEIFGITKEKPFDRLYYDYQTDQGILRVHSAEQHIYVGGGSGAGKGDSIIKPTIYQHIQNFDSPALIYDVKPEMPLTQTAHTSFYHGMQKNKKFNSQLKVFNISNPSASYRVNPFSSRYLGREDSAKLTELLEIFLTNYKAEWRGEHAKRDHWFEACITVWASLAMRFLIDDQIRDKLSLPMLCELILTHRVGSVINFILDKEESARMLSPIRMSAMGSMKQFTGEFTSAMSGLSKIIMDKNLYWLFSSDEIDFDINNSDNPTVLCVGGSEVAPIVYTPFIATILSLVMGYFREPDKLPTLFSIDEIYTIYLEKLPGDANKFRSNGISMLIGNQLQTMLEDMYGKNKSNNILGACGTQMYGMGNDIVSSQTLQNMLGEIKVENVSYSTSENSQSVSTSLKNEKVMNIRKINSQPTGHFTGKIANGKPPFFSAQFKRYAHSMGEEKLPNFVEKEYGSKEMLQQEIDQNYKSIQSYAKDILESYPNVLPQEEEM